MVFHVMDYVHIFQKLEIKNNFPQMGIFRKQCSRLPTPLLKVVTAGQEIGDWYKQQAQEKNMRGHFRPSLYFCVALMFIANIRS